MSAESITQKLKTFFHPSENEPEYPKAKVLAGAAATAMLIWLTNRSVFIPLAIAAAGFARVPMPKDPSSSEAAKKAEGPSQFSWSILENKTLQPLFFGAYLTSIFLGGSAALKAAHQARSSLQSCAYLACYGVPVVAANAWMLAVDWRQYNNAKKTNL